MWAQDLPRKTYLAALLLSLPYLSNHLEEKNPENMHIPSLSDPSFLRLSPTVNLAKLEVKFFHQGTQDGSAVTNAMFPIVHHHPTRCPCSQSCWEGWKALSGSQQLQRTDQLAGSFSPPHNKRDNEQSCLFVTWIGFLDEHIPSEPAAMLISEMIKKLLN